MVSGVRQQTSHHEDALLVVIIAHVKRGGCFLARAGDVGNVGGIRNRALLHECHKQQKEDEAMHKMCFILLFSFFFLFLKSPFPRTKDNRR